MPSDNECQFQSTGRHIVDIWLVKLSNGFVALLNRMLHRLDVTCSCVETADDWLHQTMRRAALLLRFLIWCRIMTNHLKLVETKLAYAAAINYSPFSHFLFFFSPTT